MDRCDTEEAEDLARRRLWRVLWLGLGVQSLLAFWISRPWLTEDSFVYFDLARSLSGGTYGSETPTGFQPDALRPPGYPLFLCLLMYGLRLPVAGVVLAQAGMYLVGVWMLQRFAISDARTRLVYAGLALLYPFPAFYASRIMAEAPAALALAGVVVILARPPLRDARWIGAAALAAGAALLRSDLILLPVGLALAHALYRGRAEPRRRRAMGIGLVSAAVAGGIVLPYALWNLRSFGRLTPVPIAGAAGNSLYLATWQAKLPLEDLNELYAGRFTVNVERQGLGREIRRLNAEIGAAPDISPFNPAAYATPALQTRSSRVFGREALRRIQAEPLEYARHVAAGTWRLWNTSRFPDATPVAARTFLALISAATCLLGLAGVVCAFVRPVGWTLPAISAGVLLYLPAVHVWLHTEARYTAPVRMLLLLNAAAFLTWAWSRIRQRGTG